MSTNQTRLPIESDYPERLVVPEALTSWNVELNPGVYSPPLYPDPSTVVGLLEAQGLDGITENDLPLFARLSNLQLTEAFGPDAVKLRHPLGRTGINGTGTFWQAGESRTSDIAIVRRESDRGPEIVLVYSRRWGLPGGFHEPEDHGDFNKAAVREGRQETDLDVDTLNAQGRVETLERAHTKLQSRRSVDLGFITNQVELLMLDPGESIGTLRARDDAEDAGWFTIEDVVALEQQGKISQDHFGYVIRAFDRVPAPASIR